MPQVDHDNNINQIKYCIINKYGQVLLISCQTFFFCFLFFNRRDISYFGINVCIIEPGFFKTQVTSLEPIEKELHRLWNQLTPEQKDSYGDKYLEKCKYWRRSHSAATPLPS